MNFYERYQNGETSTVYADIATLGEDAFTPLHYADVQNVLKETFNRVAHNLEVIHKELVQMDYLFKTKFEGNFDRPLVRPFANTEALLQQLDGIVRPFGFVPETLKMFYRAVGGCNFAWDYDTNEDYFWTYADPIQIIPLDDLISYITDTDWKESVQESYTEEQLAYLDLSADYLHKDNTSGGMVYSLVLTPLRSIDSLLLNEEHDTTFIDYLRITFESCGFSRITDPDEDNDFEDFFSRVKPQLMKI